MALRVSRRSAIVLGGSLVSGVRLPILRAADLSLPTGSVQFRPEIEPLVQLLENTPREGIIGIVANEIRGGRSYRELLAALFLAAIRNVEPRPAVGFKFHSVLVVNSAHLASLASDNSDRWLPLFWAIDNFKQSQSQDVKEGNWTMSAVDESRVPGATKAIDDLRQAMTNWDVDGADVAAAAAARSLPAHQLFDLFAEFGTRDFRSIGHKAIYVAGAFRVLDVIGWEYAEPVIRSLTYALLNHTGDPNPAKADLAVDRQGRENHDRARLLSKDWLGGKADDVAVQSIVEIARSATPSEMSAETAKLLNDGFGFSSIYDGLFASAAELVMRQPAIVPLHAMTTTNAVHYLFQRVQSDELRRWLLLQNSAFIGHFQESAQERGDLNSLKIDAIQVNDEPSEAVNLLDRRNEKSTGRETQVFTYLQNGGDPGTLMQRSRQLVFQKGNDSHDYKYSMALLEDFYPRSNQWRNRILAAGSQLLPSADAKDTGLADRVRSAFA